MPRNDAQQAAAQIAETRKILASQGRRTGLAESVRQDMIEDIRRQQQMDPISSLQRRHY